MVRIVRWGAALALAQALAGCSSGDGDGLTRVPSSKLDLVAFEGPQACADYKSYLADSFTDQVLTPMHCFEFGPCPVLGVPTAGGEDGVAGPPTEGAAPDRASQTNTQESGVDEADIVEVDAAGNLYVLTGRKLVVLQALPAEGLGEREQAVLDLSATDPTLYATDFFLDEANDRLVVLASTYVDETTQALGLIVDVSDPAAPTLAARIAVDGYLLGARRIAGRVHRALRFDVPLPLAVYEDATVQEKRAEYQQALADGDESRAEQAWDDARAVVGQIVAATDVAQFLPRIRAGESQTSLACDRITRSGVQTGAGLVVLDSFDSDGGGHDATAAINNAWQVYVSAANLYLTQNSRGWFFAPDQADESAVYRFELSPDAAPLYRGFGRIPGVTLGPYSFSEFEGHLRAASTQATWSDAGRDTTNYMTVLQIAPDGMPRVGELAGYAPGETIQGVRFVGDRGFVVTFLQVDPLFAFDLSDPANPAIADELEIPGFSSYLMPLGSDYLLTIGRAGDADGTTGCTAIQLFDVSDLSDISRVGPALLPDGDDCGYSWSSAEYEPHAFTYFSDSADGVVPGTLSVPLQAYAEGGGFSGFVVVRVDPQGDTPLGEVGRLDHAALAPDQGCSGVPWEADAGGDGCFAPVYAAEPRRSVFLQSQGSTLLYTLSAIGIVASDAADPATALGSALLPYEEPMCCFIEPAAGSSGGDGAVVQGK